MSVQYGNWTSIGKPPDPSYYAKVNTLLTPYGPDSCGDYSGDGVIILYRALHTTPESWLETQPHRSLSGQVITWDGRLDNRDDLIRELRGPLNSSSTDVGIVSALYEKWGLRSLGRIVGDWAISIWNPHNRSLVLARDPLGARPLYYHREDERVSWSTLLDPLVLLDGKRFALDEEYIAGWFSTFPASHLTPYVGIHSVPPASFVRLDSSGRRVERYWDFDAGKSIRHRSEKEYEEHFCSLFISSVQRRLRSDRTVVAELSGGMDSSAIVCIADTVLATEVRSPQRLKTLSFYDEAEPNWNERPYFTQVEAKRGQTGFHIPLRAQDAFLPQLEDGRFAATPAVAARSGSIMREVGAYLASQNARIVLSGIGGDEVMGGAPTPIPELADLFARADFRALGRQLKAWALSLRKPWFQLFSEAVGAFCPWNFHVPKYQGPVPWLHPRFVKNHRCAVTSAQERWKLFGPLPSFQDNLHTIDVLRRQLSCFPLSSEPPFEKRFPYLDRDLLEFMFAIPRDQIVRPMQRRSLMRRALSGIVPDGILKRNQKAYMTRAPLQAITLEWTKLAEIGQHMLSDSLGIIDAKRFTESLCEARRGREVAVLTLLRTVSLELWLRNVAASGRVGLNTAQQK